MSGLSECKPTVIFFAVMISFYACMALAFVGLLGNGRGAGVLVGLGTCLGAFLLWFSIHLWSYDLSALGRKHLLVLYLPTVLIGADALLFAWVFELREGLEGDQFIDHIMCHLVLALVVGVAALGTITLQLMLLLTLHLQAQSDFDRQALKDRVERQSPSMSVQLPDGHRPPKRLLSIETLSGLTWLWIVIGLVGSILSGIYRDEVLPFFRAHFLTIMLLNGIFFLLVYLSGRRVAAAPNPQD